MLCELCTKNEAYTPFEGRVLCDLCFERVARVAIASGRVKEIAVLDAKVQGVMARYGIDGILEAESGP